MPIKTLHITNAYHPASGGISTFYRALLDTANRLERPMRLVVPGDATRTEEVGSFGRIYHLAAPRAPFFDQRYRLLLPHNYLPPFAGALQQILAREQPDLIEVCDKYSVSWMAGLLRRGWMTGLGSRAKLRPVLVGMNCERMDDNVAAFVARGRWGKWWAQFYLGNLYLPLFDYHIANSHYTADELRQAMRAKHKRQVHVLPMGAQVAEFAAVQPAAQARRELLARIGGDEGTRILLYAGRLSPEKNVALLLEMMEQLDAAYHLVIAGAGPLAAAFARGAARRTAGRITLLGHVTDRAELIALYASADAFIHPNPREPFGIAPLEAMAAGLPLVAPRAGGLLSYADDHNAWLTEAQAARFAAAVRAVFADPSARKEKLTRARWAAQPYEWSNVAARFFALYDELHAAFPHSRFAYRVPVAGHRLSAPPAPSGGLPE